MPEEVFTEMYSLFLLVPIMILPFATRFLFLNFPMRKIVAKKSIEIKKRMMNV